MTLTQNREGQWQAGLYDAWQLVKYKTSGPAAHFIKTNERQMLGHLNTRNSSILAHGFEPVIDSDWQPIQTWIDYHFMPMLIFEAAQLGIKLEDAPLQLPTAFDLR
jgi:hypothetical protein